MPWDSVPWFTEGGAEHSSEVARVLGYAAFGGHEGTIGSADLQVKALSSPAAKIQVRPGACAILNRASGSTYQAYAARLPTTDTVDIPGTGSAARSDLIVARIENPYSYGETWPNPSDPKVGPYVFTRVISGVPNTTKSVRQVTGNFSAITLARIDIPANTSSITQAMIKDLREMANPRRQRQVRYMHGHRTGGDSVGDVKLPAWEEFPQGCRWPIEIPPWATRATIIATWSGLNQKNAKDSYGYLRARLGSATTLITNFDCDWEGTPQRHTFVGGGQIDIPASMRGTVQDGVLEGSGAVAYTGQLLADAGSTMFFDIEFEEAPREDTF
ncbi:hypothetical protein SSP531S_54020 [Streptomyces spongiicola]|uniref:Uncharacterized protein n=1 Tax=Streptomyces spongiicola TaxID=1690221 RepID=A0A388T4N7_9ACTN|nr:hypothetical protein [Streptomyces spongiicola]GBQ03923.1 hypothetical protein SSP531S_54020 [Streptomyces spongiicola]